MLFWSFLVILAWDNQKGTFLTHFFNFGHEGAPNVTKLTYNMKILWENSHRKKNWGSFVHRGLRYEFLRKKIWTVPLILQFNICTEMDLNAGFSRGTSFPGESPVLSDSSILREPSLVPRRSSGSGNHPQGTQHPTHQFLFLRRE